MSRDDQHPQNSSESAEKRLDDAIAALRAEGPSSDETAAALRRAWERIEATSAAPRGSACEDLLSELPALVAGRLPEARAGLLEAHARECLPCRRALKQEQARSAESEAGAERAAPAGGSPGGASWMRWAAAAAIVVAAVGLGRLALDRLGPGRSGPARIATLDGSLFSPKDGLTQQLAEGDAVEAGRWLRTGKGSRAVIELADGSRVEVNERSQLLVDESGEATTVRLGRGEVIVEAAKRRQRNLFVETEEMSVAVKGTIFTVEHGLKGSRVGVLEGSVQVDGGDGPLLEPGQQMASRQGLTEKSLREQVAWSRQFEEYQTLLAEIEAVQASLAARPFEHRVRHSTDLLDAMPEGTVFYAALPNNAANLRRFVELVTERLDQSPDLRAWWERQADAQRRRGEPTFDEMLDAVERLSESLGEEVVVALVVPPGADVEPVPVLVSRLRDEATLRRLVEAELGGRLSAAGADAPLLGDRRSLEEAAVGGDFGGLQLAVVGDAVVAGPAPSALLRLADRLESGPGAFARTDFHRTLAAEYRAGTETLIAFDLATLLGREAELRFGDVPLLRAAGVSGVEHFVLRSTGDEPGTAVLSFSEDRQGVASWLAEPAPMGSLQFVSPQASVVLAAVFKDPVAVLRDIEEIAGSEGFSRALDEFRLETGVDPYTDVAAPLGGELTLALDGPLFPTPAWKAIVEVYDPVRLQLTIERLVARFNEWADEQAALSGSGHGLQRFSLETVPGPAGPHHVIRMEGVPTAVHYSFADGYLIAAGGGHLLDSALRDRELGIGITTAPAFLEVMPKDGEQHFSLIAWQNLGPALGLLVQGMSGGSLSLDPRQLATTGGACMLHARADDRDIAFSISSSGAGPGAHLAALLRRALAEGLQHAAERGLLDATQRRAPGYDEPASPAEPAGRTRAY
jgi:hypothetical protein